MKLLPEGDTLTRKEREIACIVESNVLRTGESDILSTLENDVNYSEANELALRRMHILAVESPYEGEEDGKMAEASESSKADQSDKMMSSTPDEVMLCLI